MRLLMGALVCFGTLQVVAGTVLASEQSEQTDSQLAIVAGEHTKRPADNWLALDASDRAPGGDAVDPTEFDHHDSGPVLLPLPAEAWTSLTVLASLAAFRGLKKARII